MDMDEDSTLTLCSPLPESPLKSPYPKKVCHNSKEEESVSNADILRAIQELTSRFTSFEQKISKNTTDIVSKESLKCIELKVKSNNDKLHAMDRRISGQKLKSEDAEHYSQCWNLKLHNLPEAANETAEDTRKQVFKIFGLLTPDEMNNNAWLMV